MRKASTICTYKVFLEWMHFYVKFLNKIFDGKKIILTKYERKELVEALVLRIASIWETFVEDVLIDCFNKDTSQFSNYTGLKLRKHLSRDECEAIITGLGYFNIRSMSELKKIARDTLVANRNPFKEISKTVSDKIDDFFCMRNYLAHYSKKSRRALTRVYKKYGYQIFYEPGYFLYSMDKKNKKIHIGNFVDTFILAAKQMGKCLGIEILHIDI